MRGTVVTDTFTRTVSSGWGSADTGQAWSGVGAGGTLLATDTSVNGTAGIHSVPAVIAYRASQLNTFSQSYVDLAITGSIPVVPAGGTIELANVMTRATTTTNCYLFRIQLETTAAVTALIFAPGGAQLGSVTVPGITYTANLALRVRVQSVGKTHRMKVWVAANAEPAAWVLTVVDATYTGAGFVGIRSGVAAGNSNPKPILFTYDNFASILLPDFPRDPLPLTVLAAFGADLSAHPSTWPWVDITRDVQVDTVTIRHGRSDDTSQTAPANATFELLNTSASKPYSAWNAMSSNYPSVKRNTPIWIICNSATRFFGYADQWSPGWDTRGRVAIVAVSASGSLRRLTQGRPPTVSPLRRAITAQTAALRAYWPMEDTAGSVTLASGMAGGQPAMVSGLSLAADGSEPGSFPLPTFSSTGTVHGNVSGPFASRWQVDWYYKVADPVPNEVKILTVYTGDASGTPPPMNYDVFVGGGGPGGVVLRANNSLGTIVINSAAIFGPDYFNAWVHARIMVQQSGGNISWQLVLFPIGKSGGFIAGTVAGTVAGPNAVGIQPNTLLSGMAVGHLAVFDAWDLGAADQAQSGFSGELVGARLTRLCADAGVPLTIIGTSATQMGAQPLDTFVACLRECETADGGLLYDGFGTGLTYVARSARYNQAAALTVDMAAGQVAPPFRPVDDDQRNRNRYTVSRKNGSSATYEDSTGPLGTNPLTGIGLYDASATVNVASDGVLYNYASWLVHLGTVPGFRYPALNLNLVRSPELIDDWASAGLVSNIAVTNVDSKLFGHGPNTVSLLEEGYTEAYGPKTWRAALTCSPYEPWRVMVVADNALGRVDTGGSQLATAITTTATAIFVTTLVGLLWGFSDGAFDLGIDGEQMTVTALRAYLNVNPYFETNAASWTAIDGSAVRSTAQFHEGVASLLLTPSGTGPAPRVESDHVPVRAGTSYTASAWVRCAVARTVEVDIAWWDASNAFLSSTVTSVSVAATTWTQITTTATPPANAVFGAALVGMTGTPPASNTLHIDEATLTAPSTQALTVTRSVNGVVKTHAASAAVRLWRPAAVAL